MFRKNNILILPGRSCLDYLPEVKKAPSRRRRSAILLHISSEEIQWLEKKAEWLDVPVETYVLRLFRSQVSRVKELDKKYGGATNVGSKASYCTSDRALFRTKVQNRHYREGPP